MYELPVDLSFKDISCVTDALTQVPRRTPRPVKKNSEGKYLSCCLRLNNNDIANLEGFQFMVSHLLAEPSKLGWLDLSFNKLTTIPSVLCEMKELQVLYLHGNSIWNLEETDKLAELSHLQKITLHGNPVEFSKNYRNHLIVALPQVKSIDFSGVTAREKELADFWHRRPKPVHNTMEERN